MLLCPVRNCHRPLVRQERRRVCEQGHSFDIARSGYTNLLQPQERRSKQPGDTRAAVAARRRLHDLGLTRPLLDQIAQLAQPTTDDVVLDAGCGDGFYLGTLAQEIGCEAHGIDIAIPAIEAAAKRYPDCDWIVANADRFIPFAEGAFSLVCSITARMNPPEFRRVLRTGGRLLVAVPAPDDLIELRGQGRDRVARTVEEFTPHFAMLRRQRASTTAELDPVTIQDLALSIYRPRSAPPQASMQVTFSLDLLLFG